MEQILPYNARFYCLFKTDHPLIWKFMVTLDNLNADYDNTISRLELGREITRYRKRHVKYTIEYRKECKE